MAIIPSQLVLLALAAKTAGANSHAVVLVGRPNVGKSTIYNRMTKTFDDGAIVHDSPGITRDTTTNKGWWTRFEFDVVDTGGIVFDDDENHVFMPQIRQQAMIALNNAKVAVMVVDGQQGRTPLDEDIASFLRRQGVPVVLAVNKCESSKTGDLQAADFWSLGMGNPFPVSGIHGTGMGDLMDEVVAHFGPNSLGKTSVGQHDDENGEPDEPLRVAILGKPNVGKSSLLNRLTRVDRSIVSDIAGTTRDVIDQRVNVNGDRYLFLDTAGVRRASRVAGKGVEEMMVKRSLKAARRADVCVLVVDATEGASDQETKLASFVADAGRACVVCVNKWDAITGKDDLLYKQTRADILARLAPVAWASVVFCSAKTGLKTQQIFDAINAAAAMHRRRTSTSVVNEVLEDAVRWQRPPATTTGRQGTVYYCAQVSVAPPTLVIFCNDPDLFGNSYRRYLEGQFRKSLGYDGTPLRMIYRARASRRRSAAAGETKM